MSLSDKAIMANEMIASGDDRLVRFGRQLLVAIHSEINWQD